VTLEFKKILFRVSLSIFNYAVLDTAYHAAFLLEKMRRHIFKTVPVKSGKCGETG
jgi:hypothetical protein